jgi:hypothetical protein
MYPLWWHHDRARFKVLAPDFITLISMLSRAMLLDYFKMLACNDHTLIQHAVFFLG